MKKQLRARLQISIPALIILLITLVYTNTSAAANSEIQKPARLQTDNLNNPTILEADTPPTTIDQKITNMTYVSTSATIQKGINYLSQWHWYLPNVTTDEILKRDFSKFKNDGIKFISIPLIWNRLEGPSQGDFTGSNAYGEYFLANVKRVIQVANQYDIQTMVDIHTLWGKDDSWCIPSYVLDPVTNTKIGLAVVRDPKMQQAFLDMFKHTVNYLKGTPGIWCWALNEPWYWPYKLDPPFDKIDQKENFMSLFQKMKIITNSLDGRPFCVRFVSVHQEKTYLTDKFNDDWKWDSRLFSIIDIFSFTVYLPENPKLLDQWTTIVKNNVSGVTQKDKPVWISEFGSQLKGDSVVEDYYTFMNLFKTLPINGVMPWFWRSDKDELNPEPPNTGFNICKSSVTGLGKSEYNIFTSWQP